MRRVPQRAVLILSMAAGLIALATLGACGAAPTPTPASPTAAPPSPVPSPFTEVDLQPQGCVTPSGAPAERVSAPAGDFVFVFSVERASPEEAASAVGDTSAVILVGGQPTMPLTSEGLDDSGRTRQAEQLPSGQWGYTTRAQLTLPPGEYMLGGSWLLAEGILEARGCTLVVTAP